MTVEGRGSKRTGKVSTGANWLAALGVPLAVFTVCLAADLGASDRLTSDVGRAPLLFLLAAVLQLVAALSLVPWWAAGLTGATTFGTIIAGFRHLVMTASTTVLLLVLALLQDHGAFALLLKVQGVVLCVGLLVVGLAGMLRVILGSTTAGALVTTLPGYLALATPFWGNFLVQWAGDAWKSWAVAFVVNVTPLSACASAVGYDLFRGPMLYNLSVVSDFRHSLPAWWLYAAVTGLAGLVLIELTTLLRRHCPGK